ncbi:PIN domain-containing protein [Brevundimonas intermedia]|uniref:Ribonuclease VapC n=2 Tax=Brevundimonas intermedia TaxID=74315 RepID=A0A4Y9RXP1_9CAUL|nr:PIN domain-containing protein [Brevundimonas intermedia]
MMDYLLDADICIHVLRRRAPDLRERFAASVGRIALSTVTLTELLVGVAKSYDPGMRHEELLRFRSRLDLLDFDEAAAAHASDIRASLERSGQKIGPLDTLLAGQARSLGLTVVTANVREFSRVEGLLVENWLGQGQGFHE